MIHNFVFFAIGVACGAVALATLLYARWVTAALDRTEP